VADVHSKEKRSYNMSRIRSKDTKPELIVRKFLFSNGLRYRLHVKSLPGKPDIVLSKFRTVIFVHGCFWHGHDNCKYYVIPKTDTEKWIKKIERNKQLDTDNSKKLKETGWRVIDVFECDLKKDKITNTLARLLKQLKARK
jgi:DNA mismatch endonuclease, patch repair protein